MMKCSEVSLLVLIYMLEVHSLPSVTVATQKLSFRGANGTCIEQRPVELVNNLRIQSDWTGISRNQECLLNVTIPKSVIAVSLSLNDNDTICSYQILVQELECSKPCRQVSLSCENKTDSRTIWKGAERLQIIYSPIAKGEDNFQLHVDPVYDKGALEKLLYVDYDDDDDDEAPQWVVGVVVVIVIIVLAVVIVPLLLCCGVFECLGMLCCCDM